MGKRADCMACIIYKRKGKKDRARAVPVKAEARRGVPLHPPMASSPSRPMPQNSPAGTAGCPLESLGSEAALLTNSWLCGITELSVCRRLDPLQCQGSTLINADQCPLNIVFSGSLHTPKYYWEHSSVFLLIWVIFINIYHIRN